MKKNNAILIERFIAHRCQLLMEQASTYANMSDEDLYEKYNVALQQYYDGMNNAEAFRQLIAQSALDIMNKDIDMTRPMFAGTDMYMKLDNQEDVDYAIRRSNKYNKRKGLKAGDEGYQDPNQWKIGMTIPAERTSKIYLPGSKGGYPGGNMKRTTFVKMMEHIKNGKDYVYRDHNKKQWKIPANQIRNYFGIDESWGVDRDGNFHIATTDNTCAMFTCTALDMALANQRENEGLSNFDIHLSEKDKKWKSKNMTASEWNEFLNAQAGKYINTAGYMASPEKIMRAQADNQDTWTSFNMDDFQKDVAEGDRLDPYSEEFWNKYIQPGDMIVYHNPKHDPSKTSQHIAIAGHNGLQIYHDGDTTHNVKENSNEKNHAYYKGKKNYSHFTIVRHTNQSGIDELKNITTAIQNEFDNRNLAYEDNYQQDSDGFYAMKLPEIQPIELKTLPYLVDNDADDIKIEPVVSNNPANNTITPQNSVIKPKQSIFKRFANWTHNLFQGDDKQSKQLAGDNDQSNTNVNPTTSIKVWPDFSNNQQNTSQTKNNTTALNTTSKNIEKELA